MDEIDYERTLVQLPQVHVFKIPSRRSAEGHKAADWPKDAIWSGRLKIVAKGRIASIVLMDGENREFARCNVTDDTCVERTVDSGRYFVLRITNAQGKHAFIGIAFNERNDSFDFNVTLQEHKAEVEREDRAAKGIIETSNVPTQDFSLKQGEKIKVKIGSGVKKEKTSTGGGGMLAPPPGSKGLLAPPPGPKPGLLAPPPGSGSKAPAAGANVFTKATSTAAATTPAPAPAPSAFDSFDSQFSSMSVAPKPAPAPAQASTSASAFDSFAPSVPSPSGGNDPFSVFGAAPAPAPASDPFGGFATSSPKAPAPAPASGATGNLLDF